MSSTSTFTYLSSYLSSTSFLDNLWYWDYLLRCVPAVVLIKYLEISNMLIRCGPSAKHIVDMSC